MLSHGKLDLSRNEMNGEVRGIYVLAGGSKCSVVIADWLVCIADVSGCVFAMCFWRSNFRACFLFFVFL